MPQAPSIRHPYTRGVLARQLRELRSWPPFRDRTDLSLRRPEYAAVELRLQEGQSLQAVLEQCALHWVSSGDAEMLLSQLFLKVQEPYSGDFGVNPTLVVYRKALANDRAYLRHLAPLWQRYQQDSQVSDDTAAQYREYLRLKQIYDPVGDEEATGWESP